MWGKPPFSIPESFALKVRDLQAARHWYVEKLEFRDGPKDVTDDSGLPFAVHQLRIEELLILLETADPISQTRSYGVVSPILFASNLSKTHAWLTSRGVAADPIQRDSGGNELFHFTDLDGNKIEVCKDPE